MPHHEVVSIFFLQAVKMMIFHFCSAKGAQQRKGLVEEMQIGKSKVRA